MAETTNLIIVGAYPAGQEAWDLKRNTPEDLAQAKAEIAMVGRPQFDPVAGDNGPLLHAWPVA